MKVLVILVKLQKDQWAQFSAVLLMKKSQTMICKVLNYNRIISRVCKWSIWNSATVVFFQIISNFPLAAMSGHELMMLY